MKFKWIKNDLEKSSTINYFKSYFIFFAQNISVREVVVVKKSSCSLLKKKKFKPGPIMWTWLINNQNLALFSVPANCGNSQKKKKKKN